MSLEVKLLPAACWKRSTQPCMFANLIIRSSPRSEIVCKNHNTTGEITLKPPHCKSPESTFLRNLEITKPRREAAEHFLETTKPRREAAGNVWITRPRREAAGKFWAFQGKNAENLQQKYRSLDNNTSPPQAGEIFENNKNPPRSGGFFFGKQQDPGQKIRQKIP